MRPEELSREEMNQGMMKQSEEAPLSRGNKLGTRKNAQNVRQQYTRLSENDEIRLERIVFIGRTYDEYMRMFDLNAADLVGIRVLDCPAGACSFTAAAQRIGIDVTAADIAYQFGAEELENKGMLDIQHAVQRVESIKEQFRWDEFVNPEGLRAERTKALTETIQDMKLNPDRYIPVVLPDLPFSDRQFDITLSAHFLFMYNDQLDYHFHQQTLQELMRVTRSEIRIFPLVDQTSRKYEHLQTLLDFAKCQGWAAEEREVGYEFQRKACSMLVLTKI